MSGGTVLLFDWNGTVVLDAERARLALNGVLVARGLPELDRAGFAREFHLPMADMFVRLGVADPLVAEGEWNTAMAAAPAPLRPGLESVADLGEAGARLGVISAASEAAVGADIAHHGLSAVWDSVDTSVTDKLATLRARRGAERQAFYVGDTAYDMRCAVEAGYVAVAVSGGYSAVDVLRDAGAQHVIDSLDALEALFGQGAVALG
ncbi:HAD family hydrolase [Demequina sp. NBRC 110057]|uniref:HAD family hydrolase n=1 Tax=Demequina sp. NBRC 110057 TaxID=1570346 RepID=UPI000A017C3B|nr:HAD hydrolase-like protein [Demequina sp. NBRC 110057]